MTKINYKQYDNLQTRKAISAYGGVGSILETRDGSIMVDEFSNWPYFKSFSGKFGEDNFIKDKRFKNRLNKYFKNLEALIRIPINDLDDGYFSNGTASFLSAKYFPEWFYCNKCRKFDNLTNWLNHWGKNVQEYHQDNFYSPKCYRCYLEAQKKSSESENPKAKKKGRKLFFELEQIRFVLTSPSGDISDIPWERWAMGRNKVKGKGKEENEEQEKTEEKVFFLPQIDIPEGLELELKVSDKLDDLNGIWVIAKDKNGKQLEFTTLSGLFNMRVYKNEIYPNSNSRDLFKPVIRSSNSVYYPNILSSIFLPAKDDLNEKIVDIIKSSFEDGNNAESIFKEIKRNHKSIEIELNEIQKLIDNNFSLIEVEIAKSENEYRYDEYKFINANQSANIEDNLIFEKIQPPLFSIKEIKSIYRMDKIKVTNVQTSFTRQEPIHKDYFLVDDDEIKNTKDAIKKKYTSEYAQNTKYLPAVESFGEGIFFEFDAKEIEKWATKHTAVSRRATKINSHNHESDSNLNKSRTISAGHILIHTFSHLIIKELEFLCGYPATSIQERLYFDEGKMQGVMIYTIAGAEGSYGGLSSICKSDKIGKLIRSALFRATDCSSDPICYESTGQGVGNLNFAACYSCALLPETSCEEFNCFLDRRMLVDKNFGFLKQYIKE